MMLCLEFNLEQLELFDQSCEAKRTDSKVSGGCERFCSCLFKERDRACLKPKWRALLGQSPYTSSRWCHAGCGHCFGPPLLPSAASHMPPPVH